MKAKTKNLLLGVATALDEQREPFGPERIREMNLPLDELMDLAGLCARIVRGYANATRNTQMLIDLCATAGDGTGVTPESIELVMAQKALGNRTDELCKQLHEVAVAASSPGTAGAEGGEDGEAR